MVLRAIIMSFFAVFLVSRESFAIEAWGLFQLTQNGRLFYLSLIPYLVVSAREKIAINKNVFFMYFCVLAQRIKYFVIESLQN